MALRSEASGPNLLEVSAWNECAWFSCVYSEEKQASIFLKQASLAKRSSCLFCDRAVRCLLQRPLSECHVTADFAVLVSGCRPQYGGGIWASRKVCFFLLTSWQATRDIEEACALLRRLFLSSRVARLLCQIFLARPLLLLTSSPP